MRLPQHNVIQHNIFADYGVWDKQSACMHKALAPYNTFRHNVCLNASRDHVLVPCGHACVCDECCRTVTLCPICRAPVERAVRLYDS